MMKKCLTTALIICQILIIAGCDKVSDPATSISSIKTYQDIPGVTGEEITAMEAIIGARRSFSYGQMSETEAFILPDGTYDGFTARLCELLSNLFGIEFTLELYDLKTLQDGFENGTIDFSGDFSPTPENTRRYLMTRPIAERSLRVFQYEKSADILTENDLIGLRIGSLAGTLNISQINEYYSELEFFDIPVDSYDAAAQMLRSGEIDVFVADATIDQLMDDYGFIKSKELFSLIYTPVSMSTANTELEPVINVVNKYLAAGGIDILFNLYKDGNNAYERYKFINSLSDKERAYLTGLTKQNTAVKLAFEWDNYPISFYNETDKEFQGIAIDVLSAIGELTGLKIGRASCRERV